MKKWIGFLCALCAALMIAVSAMAAEVAVVNNPDPTDRLNLRTKPSSEAVTLGKYYNGVKVFVYSIENGWAKVDVQGRQGYMKNEYLAYGTYENGVYRPFGTYSGSVYQPWSAVPTMSVKSTTLNLRRDTSTNSGIIRTYPYGTQVEIIGVGTSWHHVLAPGDNGGKLVGYMKAEHLAGDVSFHKKAQTKTEEAVVANPNVNDRLNLRASPSEKAASLGKFYNCTPVKVLEKRADGWCKVEIGETGGVAKGYMKSNYLAFGDRADAVVSGIECYSVAYDAAIVKGADGTGEVVQMMQQGEAVYVLGDIGESYCFVMTRNMTGYFPRWALVEQAL